MKKIFLASLLVLLILISGCVQTEKQDTDVKTGHLLEEESRPLLIVAENWPPFEYVEDGKVKGIDVEIVDKIMKKLNITYEIKIFPWSRAWKMIQNGDADACLSLSYKNDREDYVYYTEEQKAVAVTGKIPENYLWVCEYVFFIRKVHEDSLKFESYEQIKEDGYRLAVIRDNSYFPEFWEVKLDLYIYPNAEDCIKALANGEVDIYPVDKTIGLATIKNLGLEDELTYIPKVLFSKVYYSPFVKNSGYPNSEETMMKVYEELKKMHENGKYQEIYDRYTKKT